VTNKIVKLIEFITNEDILGVARFIKITENMGPRCSLPHQPLKIDLPVAGFITRSLLEKDQTTGIYKNLNLARDQIVNLIKDGSIGSKKQLETLIELLNQ
jgi:hypothetical protein